LTFGGKLATDSAKKMQQAKVSPPRCAFNIPSLSSSQWSQGFGRPNSQNGNLSFFFVRRTVAYLVSILPIFLVNTSFCFAVYVWFLPRSFPPSLLVGSSAVFAFSFFFLCRTSISSETCSVDGFFWLRTEEIFFFIFFLPLGFSTYGTRASTFHSSFCVLCNSFR